MSKLVGVFVLGILIGWLIEWIFVQLFVPNPKTKLEAALKATRKESDALQQQNRTLQQAELIAIKTEQSAPAIVQTPIQQTPIETAAVDKPVVTPEPEPETITGADTKATVVTETVVNKHADSDDLTKLSGIGPKLAEAMQANGIKRYAELAKLTTDELNEKLASSGIRYSKAFAESWAEQAKLASASNWSGLKTYQQTLKS